MLAIRMHTRLLILLLGLTPFVTEPLHAQERAVPVPVTGRIVKMSLPGGEQVTGELIEARDDAVVLLGAGGLRTLDLGGVSSVSVQRHGLDGSKVLTWVGIGALVTAGGLTIACSQVEGTSCGGVFLAVGLSWGLIGGLFGYSIAGGSSVTVAPSVNRLAPYARFPQGAPTGFVERRAGGGRSP